jgi:hypothetical protein
MIASSVHIFWRNSVHIFFREDHRRSDDANRASTIISIAFLSENDIKERIKTTHLSLKRVSLKNCPADTKSPIAKAPPVWLAELLMNESFFPNRIVEVESFVR